VTQPGFEVLAGHIARAEAARDAVWCRVGIEAAGHYHYALAARRAAAPWGGRSRSVTLGFAS
jgi:hypothetical protein